MPYIISKDLSHIVYQGYTEASTLRNIIIRDINARGGKINKSFASKEVERYSLQDLDGDTDLEKLYIVLYGRQYCQACGNKVKFISWSLGYNKTCCVECQSIYQSNIGKIRRSRESEEVKRRRVERCKATFINKYGVNSPTKLESTRDKAKKTCLERYGVEHYSQTEECRLKVRDTCLERYGTTSSIQSEQARQKTAQTNLERYGVENVFNLQSVQERCRETLKQNYTNEELHNRAYKTCLERYGVEHYSKTDEYKERIKNTNQLKVEKFERDNDCIEIKKVLLDYGTGWKQSARFSDKLLKYKERLFVPRYLIKDIEEYSNNSLNNKSHAELDILEFCRGLVANEVRSGDKATIKNSNGNYMELDIYIPEKKLAIEYNGLRWHNISAIGDKGYHLDKTNLCREQGIRLLHIWEDLWESKQDIYKSIISSALGIYEQRIYARDCECSEISSKDYKDFLISNHIQGEVTSALRLGLFYNGELVQVAGWGKSRFKKGDYELHRMCSKLNTQVIGGFSKLIKHSGLNEFISYVDRDLYDGSGYSACGFECIGESEPGYFYYKDGSIRINRLSAQKSKLRDILGDKFNPDLTEKENMMSNGYYLIYNCGNYIVKYSRKLS